MEKGKVTFRFTPDAEVHMRTQHEEGKCSELGRSLREHLADRYAMGEVQQITSDTVKDAKVVANVSQKG